MRDTPLLVGEGLGSGWQEIHTPYRAAANLGCDFGEASTTVCFFTVNGPISISGISVNGYAAFFGTLTESVQVKPQP
ncbi:MAG: hypothetical protein ACP5RN_01865 [Armatimonadota bacterium]